MKLDRLPKPAVGTALALLSTAVALAVYQIPLSRTMEWKVYDLEFRALSDPSRARNDIVMVEIDDRSIEGMKDYQVGRFPWPRDVFAVLLDFLERGRPSAVVFDLLFLEDDQSSAESPTFDATLAEATARLGNVVHAIDVNDTHHYQPKLSLPGGYALGSGIEEHLSVKPPFDALARSSRALGHTLMVLDPDGPVRRAVPFVRQGDEFYPSLSVATAMLVLGVQPADVRMDQAGLWLGPVRMPLFELDTEYVDRVRVRHLLVPYKGPPFRDDRRLARTRTYRSYPFFNLFLSELQLQDEKKPVVDPSAFSGKIVIVGTTGAGLHDLFQTPFGRAGMMPGMQIHASVIDGILSRSFIKPAAPGWPILLLAMSTLLVGFIGLNAGFWWTLLATVVIGAGDAGIAALCFRRGTWLPCVPTALGLLTVLFSSVAYKYFVEDRAKRQVRSLFSRYVSPEVVKDLIADPSRARLGGERREMSVLFSDIRGFTTFSEAGRPEDVIRQLNEYFSRMVDLLFENHGTLDKFVGDMIMGLFGAPVPDADHADNAVRMGLAMLRELEVLNTGWRNEGRPNFDIGIGINTGEMIVGNVGSEKTLSYTVIGDNVNLGSRLESLNKQFGSHIIISESTLKRLKGQYFTRPLGKVKVKGKTRDVEIFEICSSREELERREAESRQNSGAPAG